MSGTKTATVEALTAEVRVLMVGSRQITLSVVRQLDEVDAEEIEPFGRVRAARKPDRGDVEVVGSADGILAYAVAKSFPHWCRMNYAYYSDSLIARCPEHSLEVIRVGGSSRTREVVSGNYGDDRRLEAWKDHRWFSYRPSQELWDEWCELPLIVLAGLR